MTPPPMMVSETDLAICPTCFQELVVRLPKMDLVEGSIPPPGVYFYPVHFRNLLTIDLCDQSGLPVKDKHANHS